MVAGSDGKKVADMSCGGQNFTVNSSTFVPGGGCGMRGGALFEQTYDGTVENVAAYRPLRICGDQLSMFVSRANYDGLFSNATLPQKSCAQLNEDNERFVTYLGQPVYTLSCNQDQTLSGKRRIPGGNCTAPTFKPYS
eukprot:GHVT01037328.1.p1 GENE.GHVT01037328.1~~GHVT01037328.1.p1  ORF type:complete len:138 (-),score=9.98 GHVT01037328.1:262-675(-)